MEKEAFSRIERARVQLVMSAPFFGVLASNLTPVCAPECETMATDGVSLFFAPEFVMTMADDELRFVMAHEAYHCALAHMSRIGWRDLPEFNIAADLAINWELSRLNVGRMPQGGWLDAAFADMGAEEIYAVRAQQKRKEEEKQAAESQQGEEGEQAPGNGAPGKDEAGTGDSAGQGEEGTAGDAGGDAGQDGAPGASNASGDAGNGQGEANGKPGNGRAHGGTFGGILKPGNGSEAASQEIADKWQDITRQAVAVASKQAGDMPGMFKRILGELASSPMDARQELRDFIDSRVATDSSFSRPNRRFVSSGQYLPGAIVDGLEHVILAVDTSGSIDAHMLERAAAVIVDAVDDGRIQRLTVLFADTEVRHVQEFTAGDSISAADLDARGGGGTRFDRVFDWIAEHAPDATACIYLTDAYCSHWGNEPESMPVLWAIHGDSREFPRLSAQAPFGECIYIGRLE